MTDNSTDLITRTNDLETVAALHEKRIVALENKPATFAASGSNTNANGFTADEMTKIRYVFDKYFPLETPPVVATQAAPVASVEAKKPV